MYGTQASTAVTRPRTSGADTPSAHRPVRRSTTTATAGWFTSARSSWNQAVSAAFTRTATRLGVVCSQADSAARVLFFYSGSTEIYTVMLAVSFLMLFVINLIQAWSRRRFGYV